jgi:hypothetical protein
VALACLLACEYVRVRKAFVYERGGGGRIEGKGRERVESSTSIPTAAWGEDDWGMGAGGKGRGGSLRTRQTRAGMPAGRDTRARSVPTIHTRTHACARTHTPDPHEAAEVPDLEEHELDEDAEGEDVDERRRQHLPELVPLLAAASAQGRDTRRAGGDVAADAPPPGELETGEI